MVLPLRVFPELSRHRRWFVHKKEENLLRLWCLKTCSAAFLHSDSVHWRWSIQRTHASHRLSLMVSNRVWAAAVRWYLNFLICFPVKKLHFFTVFFYLGVDSWSSLYCFTVYFTDPMFIVSSEKDHNQANIQATMIRSKLVGLIHLLRQPNVPESSSLANCVDQIF